MNRLKLLYVVTCSLVLTSAARAADPLTAFPPAEEGMKRFVIRVPAQDEETGLKVELILGKVVTTDPVNKHFFGGKIERVTVKGWGYSYYILRKLGPMAGTRMAPPPGAEQIQKFVQAGKPGELLRYNSRMPLVVYVPADVEVRYKIWRADEKFSPAEEG